MTIKEEFLTNFNKMYDYIKSSNPTLADECMTENVKAYLQVIEESKKADKPEITDNGKVVLAYMQQNTKPSKARDISDRLGIASRTISGALRKLVGDGFVEKISDNPVVYAITDKGKNYKID